jgi:dTDP-4-dehydrorhamnose 3,5-epimerase-like enzyme
MTGGLDAVRWIDLPVRADPRGTLTIVGHDEIPFSITRLFYVRDVPAGIERGGHAHRVTEQFVLAMNGAFSLELTDGRNKRCFRIESSKRGVYIPPMVWDRVYDFNTDAVCLVLASTQYAESDYIRDWPEFLRLKGHDPIGDRKS